MTYFWIGYATVGVLLYYALMIVPLMRHRIKWRRMNQADRWAYVGMLFVMILFWFPLMIILTIGVQVLTRDTHQPRKEKETYEEE